MHKESRLLSSVLNSWLVAWSLLLQYLPGWDCRCDAHVLAAVGQLYTPDTLQATLCDQLQQRLHFSHGAWATGPSLVCFHLDPHMRRKGHSALVKIRDREIMEGAGPPLGTPRHYSSIQANSAGGSIDVDHVPVLLDSTACQAPEEVVHVAH